MVEDIELSRNSQTKSAQKSFAEKSEREHEDQLQEGDDEEKSAELVPDEVKDYFNVSAA